MLGETKTGHPAGVSENPPVGCPEKLAVSPENWVQEHGDFLFNYAVMRLRDHAAAQDAVQEAFLAALRSQASYRGKSEERGWLLGILKHKIYDHFRRTARRAELSQVEFQHDEMSGEFQNEGLHRGAWTPELAPRPWPGPEESLDQAAFWEVFHNCSSKLPRQTARAFLLREMDDLDSRQICDLLGISENNLWVLLHRARLALRRCLETNWFAKANK